MTSTLRVFSTKHENKVIPKEVTEPETSTETNDSEAGLQYQKKSPREHVLLRPQPYIGSVGHVTEQNWVVEGLKLRMDENSTVPISNTSLVRTVSENSELERLEFNDAFIDYREIQYAPALYKIFDELVVNAADNTQRKSPRKMSYIKINIRRHVRFEDGTIGCEISVENDGASIPIVVHSVEKVYVPELIFGHMLTSSNYDDSVERFTGGRHGYGAKLTNIFSKVFQLDICDGPRNLIYHQTFRDNMAIVEQPLIHKLTKEEQTRLILKKSPNSTSESKLSTPSYTRITFRPDLARFGYDPSLPLDYDMFVLMTRRCLDLAANLGSRGIRVYLNEIELPMKSYQEYLSKCPAFSGSTNTATEDNTKEEPQETSKDLESNENELEAIQKKSKIIFATIDDRWTIGIGPRVDDDGAFLSGTRHISFVNSIFTSRGGSHVSYILDQITKYVVSYMNNPSRKKKLGIQGADILPMHVKPRITVFVSALIPNPSFDSQTKDFLLTPIRNANDPIPSTTEISAKGKPAIGCNIPERILHRICTETGIVENVVEYINGKQDRELKKQMNGTKRRKGKEVFIVEKLDDANYAGTMQSSKCTLILTEGDSAKALAIAGLSVIGREYYGVYPLKGKPLNVREVSKTTLKNNKELLEVAQILGLEYGVDYSTEENFSKLRYGNIMIMADQDHDGSHIKGLILNFIDCFWPSLIQREGFLKTFITPIIKCTPTNVKRSHAHSSNSNSTNSQVLSFYTLRDYNAWKSSQTDKQLAKYNIKYYKGLGTSTAAEAREYFSNLKSHTITFKYKNTNDSKALDLAFNRSVAEARKKWLQHLSPKDADYDESVPVTTTTINPDNLSYHDQLRLLNNIMTIYNFVHNELIYFSYYDTVRSIPNLMDGLKPGQRKVLFGSFKRNLQNEVKVAQLTGYVAEHTGYHHGEASLSGTIVNMAQSYVFSNNIPFLSPVGQFGTRHLGGKDAASPRYIFTKLEDITRKIFRQEDDAILKYNNDDGVLVEPEYFAPVIPTVLVNGCEGIGTGYSTNIPTFHPIDVASNILRKLRNQPYEPIVPFSYGYQGTIVHSPIPQDPYRFLSYGKVRITSPTTIEIYELPWGVWTNNYKQFLTSLLEYNNTSSSTASNTTNNGLNPSNTPKSDGSSLSSDILLQGFTEHHTENTVLFKLAIQRKVMVKVLQGNIYDIFKLSNSIRLSNMHLFNHKHQIRLYSSPDEIFDEFYTRRLQLYIARKQSQLEKYHYNKIIAQNKQRFIQAVCDNELVIFQKPIKEVIHKLAAMNYCQIINTTKLRFPSPDDTPKTLALDKIDSSFTLNKYNRQENLDAAPNRKHEHPDYFVDNDGYDYLTEMPISHFSAQRISNLQSEITSLQSSIEKLNRTTPEEMWISDVEHLISSLNKQRFPLNHNTISTSIPNPCEVYNEDFLKSMRKSIAREKDMAIASAVGQNPTSKTTKVKNDSKLSPKSNQKNVKSSKPTKPQDKVASKPDTTVLLDTAMKSMKGQKVKKLEDNHSQEKKKKIKATS